MVQNSAPAINPINDSKANCGVVTNAFKAPALRGPKNRLSETTYIQLTINHNNPGTNISLR
jgi:hypothetical protein